MRSNRFYEKGATAIIVVIFSVLLLLTVSVGFMRLVVQDQNRSTESELSRGAYDSALAGVEDGKRVLEACMKERASGVDAGPACDAIKNAGDSCDTVARANVAGVIGAPEVSLGRVNNDTMAATYDQAYTCVKISEKSPDYLGSVQADKSDVVALDSDASFSEITVSWYQKSDVLGAVSLRPSGDKSLPPLSGASGWNVAGKQTPPLLRVQLIQRDRQSFKMDDFDSDASSRTLFLVPSTAGSNSLNFALDARKSSTTAELQSVRCDPANEYVCSTKITLLNTIDERTSANGKTAYLRVSPMYGNTDYKITLTNANFDGVQAVIDSTGRASNVFRRVKARAEFVSAADLYPRATVDVTKNLCKDFSVTTSAGDYRTNCNYDQP